MTGAAKQVIKPRGDAARKNENVERMGFGKLTLINFLACKLALEGEGGDTDLVLMEGCSGRGIT